MDIVFIKGLEVEAIVGIYDFERRAKQVVLIDAEMAFDLRPAAESESIELALNYKSVAERLKEEVQKGKFFLVETMAEHLAAVIMTEFSVPWVRLEVGKPQALSDTESVGVRIERGEKV